LFGPRLRNLMIQVCTSCLDQPQESGRTIILPPDPVPVSFPLPEDYAAADNPASYLGYNVATVPLAAFGLVAPWLAAIGMSASSLAVILNALRIGRGWRMREAEETAVAGESAGRRRALA